MDLEQLWRDRVEEILGICAAGGDSHREVAVMSEYVEADYHGRFLVELLQNANDQAVKAGHRDSLVSLLRTRSLFAAANQGNPFDKDGLKSVTSLGLSPKDPMQLIGNKGIGFKSVYQVSRSPEIYSAGRSGKSFRGPDANHFRMLLHPFETPRGAELLLKTCASVLQESPALQTKLQERTEGDPLQNLLNEVKRAAPFKFPLAISAADAQQRFAEIGGLPEGAQTLVVLPLIEGDKIGGIVTRAIDEVLDGQGAAILFLPGIGRLRILDQERGTDTVIERQSWERVTGGDGVSFERVVMVVSVNGNRVAEREWRLAASVFGSRDEGDSRRLQEAARKLPGSKWDAVTSSRVSVAIPLHGESNDSGPLDGKLCIGLPTKDRTGTPAWAHAHFFGTISRKDIDLTDCDFNRILFQEVLHLHGLLLERLKTDPDIRAKRAVTLAYARSEGPLADVIHRVPLLNEPVILDESGFAYIQPAEVSVFDPADFRMARKILDAAGDLRKKIRLAEPWLAENASELLRTLTPQHGKGWNAAFLRRDAGQNSILEAAAQNLRSNGASAEEWEPFFEWLLRSFPTDALREQCILPTVGGRLAAAIDTVFLPPRQRSGSAGREAAEIVDEEEEQIDLDSVPTDVLSLLNLLDPSAVRARDESGRRLTAIGSLLAPDVGIQLVRRPRLEEILDSAVAPAMKQFAATTEDLPRAIALLRLAAEWLSRISETPKAKAVRSRLLVPVVKSDDAGPGWIWQSATKAYFGVGWLDPAHEALLLEAYGDRDETLTISWNEFSAAASASIDDRAAWVSALQMVGVSQWPKLLQRPAQWRRAAYQGWSYDHLNIIDLECPIPAAAEWWPTYLEAYRRRPLRTKSGYFFDFAAVTWVDGLETEVARPAVFRLVLLHHDSFERHLTTTLERQGSSDKDPFNVHSFWVHAIRHCAWPIVPTSHGLKASCESWLLELGQSPQMLKRLETLSTIDPEHRHARPLLRAVGVSLLSEPPIDRLIKELDRIARRCNENEQNRTQAVLAMAQDLYERLQKTFGEKPDDVLPELSDLWLPLEREGKPVGVPAKEISIAYVDDAPERAKFIPGFTTALLWPLQTRFRYEQLVENLRAQLGIAAVTFTRQAQVATGFVRNPCNRIQLLEWLKTEFPKRDVATDLGCLVAYTGRDTPPAGDEFNKIWRGFQVCQIAFGGFPVGAPAEFFLDTSERGERELQVDEGLSKSEILATTWVLVAPSYRDTWRAYVEYLSREDADSFFRERKIFAAHREEVESAIGVSGAGRLNRFKPALFAIWRKGQGLDASVARYEREWDQNTRSVEALCKWLGCELPPALIIDLAYMDEEQGSLKLLGAGNVTIPEWQSARRELGQPGFRFSETESLWEQTKRQLGALLKSTAARSSLADLDEMQALLELVAPEAVPTHYAESRAPIRELLGDVVGLFRSAVLNVQHNHFREVITRRLAQVAELPVGSPREIKLDDPPDRDVTEYRDLEESVRSQRAQERLNALVEVCRAVAAELSEPLDVEAIRNDPRIRTLLTGYWANRFCLLPAFQTALKAAPLTHQQLTEAGVFRSPLSLNEMLALLPGISLRGQETEIKPARTVRILGSEIAESDVEADIAKGELGALGQKLKEWAKSDPFQLNTFNMTRGTVTLQQRERTGHRGGRRRSTQESERDKVIFGRLGEIFVYELLKARAIPGFDETAWQSENRSQYLGEGQGNDSLGYDFCFKDESGLLTGCSGALCMLEVKSSSNDSGGPFQMSENEWARAIEAHRNPDEVYVILRVAHVSDSPAVVDLIVDPYQLRREGKLQLIAADLWVHPGQLQSDGDE